MPFQHLPLWIQLGAFFLAVNAGMINVLGLVTVLHQSVSHMTEKYKEKKSKERNRKGRATETEKNKSKQKKTSR